VATYYNDRPIPTFLRITGTQEKNDDGVDRQEVVLPHKSSKLTYHLLDEKERKRNNEDG